MVALRCEDAMVIADGAYSTVYRGLQGGQVVAVKCMHHFLTPSQAETDQLVHSLDATKRLCHPNIVRIKGTCFTEDGCVGAIMEYCAGGSLHDLFAELYHRRPRIRLPWAEALRIAKQVAYALLYLHGTAHVIHGDLKPSSVLFRSEDRSHLVLTDIAILKPLRSLGVRGVQQEDGPLFGRPASRSESPNKARLARQPFYKRIPVMLTMPGESTGGTSSSEEVVSFQCAVPGLEHTDRALQEPTRRAPLPRLMDTLGAHHRGPGGNRDIPSNASGRASAPVVGIRQEDTHRPPLDEERWIYLAPETLMHGRFSYAGDVYSYGLLLYELFTGRQPFVHHTSYADAALSATCGERPSLQAGVTLPATLSTLIRRCWASEPADRPSSADIQAYLDAITEEVVLLDEAQARCCVCSGCSCQ
eukprot:jgi/Tetstr1/447768/TSEL_035100.t1